MTPAKLFCVFLSAVLSGFALAQTTTYPDTLEYLTDASDVVVQARVVSATETEGKGSYLVRLESEQWLKGVPPSKFDVLVEGSADDLKLLKAPRDGPSPVWFLTKPATTGPYRIDDLANHTFWLTPPGTHRRLISMYALWADTSEQIISEVKKEVALKPKRDDRVLKIAIPTWFSITGDPNTLAFPNDVRLEPMARKWVQPGTENPLMRTLGAEILGNFKSDANIANLRALANDAGSTDYHGYGVKSDFRKAAIDVLTQWGVTIPPPTIELLDPSTISSRPIRVEIDGVEVTFGRGISPPRIIGDRAYARVCSLSDALHVKMWNHGTLNVHRPSAVSYITLEKTGLNILMPIDSHNITVNDQAEQAPQVARDIKGEGFFPIRYIVEKLGGTVTWDPSRHMVVIRMGT